MGHLWLGILVILALDAVLLAVVAAIAFTAVRSTQRPADQQARRFAEAVARQDFAAAEAAATQAMTDARLSSGGREQR
ncbi:MAG TPA: hypothetical protein VGA45_17920 [Actinomycetota bacterium]